MPKKPKNTSEKNVCRFHPGCSCDPCSKGARQTNIGSSTHLATLGSRTFQKSSVGSMALQIRAQKLAKQNQFPSSESLMPESIATLISSLSFSESAPFMVNIQMNPWKNPVTPVVHWFMFAKFPHQNGHFYCGKKYRSETPIFQTPDKIVFPAIEHGTHRLPIHQAVGLCHHTWIVEGKEEET